MIHILKLDPPKELLDYKKSFDPQKSYENFRDKDSIRKALLEEQGYICAYCMCAIGYDGKSLEKEVRIEHYRSQNISPELQLDYNNMFAVCTCSLGLNEKQQHCDVLKSNKYLHFDPKNLSHINTIKYSEGGIISADEKFNDDIENVIGLNNSYLPVNRRNVLVNEIDITYAWIKKGISKDKAIQKLLSIYSNKDKWGRYRPYCGIIIEYCNKLSRR